MRPSSFFATSKSVLNKLWTIWHRCLGHLNNASLIQLFKLGCSEHSVDDKLISTFVKSKCESCCFSKSHMLPFPVHYSCATEAFDVNQTDVWGIAPHLSRMGYKYVVTFIDDHCRYTWIYFLLFKYEVFPTFQKFHNMVCTRFSKFYFPTQGENRCPQKYHLSYLVKASFIRNLVLTHPNKNGVAERKNQHILEKVCSLLVKALVPPKFWCEVAHTAIHIINRLPSSVLQKVSPYE